jgi:hypothetical protein
MEIQNAVLLYHYSITSSALLSSWRCKDCILSYQGFSGLLGSLLLGPQWIHRHVHTYDLGQPDCIFWSLFGQLQLSHTGSVERVGRITRELLINSLVRISLIDNSQSLVSFCIDVLLTAGCFWYIVKTFDDAMRYKRGH